MAPKLAIRGLSKWFGALEALRSLDLAIERGGFVSLVGPSGCGKTTLLRIVAGLEPATAGEVLIDAQVRVAFVSGGRARPIPKPLRAAMRADHAAEQHAAPVTHS